MKIEIGHESIEATTEVPREGGRIVLAHGELTGHAHAIRSRAATLYDAKSDDVQALALGTRILAAREVVELQHEEHATIAIPMGTFGLRGEQYNPTLQT